MWKAIFNDYNDERSIFVKFDFISLNINSKISIKHSFSIFWLLIFYSYFICATYESLFCFSE